MKQPKTEYREDISTADEAYLFARAAEAFEMAMTIRDREARNSWAQERTRCLDELESRGKLAGMGIAANTTGEPK